MFAFLDSRESEVHDMFGSDHAIVFEFEGYFFITVRPSSSIRKVKVPPSSKRLTYKIEKNRHTSFMGEILRQKKDQTDSLGVLLHFPHRG